MKRGYIRYKTNLIDNIGVVSSEKGLEQIFLLEDSFDTYLRENPELEENEELCKPVRIQLDEYFRGIRKDFDLELIIDGTKFQTDVWNSLAHIPYGETVSYSDIAISINNPKSVRAVGGASKKNKLPIVIPCHRVVGKNGNLVGFLGDKTYIKEKLLEHENKYK